MMIYLGDYRPLNFSQIRLACCIVEKKLAEFAHRAALNW